MPVEKAQQLQALLKESRKENVASKADRLTSDALCKQLRKKLEAAQSASAAEQDGLQANACCYCPRKQRLQTVHVAQSTTIGSLVGLSNTYASLHCWQYNSQHKSSLHISIIHRAHVVSDWVHVTSI